VLQAFEQEEEVRQANVRADFERSVGVRAQPSEASRGALGQPGDGVSPAGGSAGVPGGHGDGGSPAVGPALGGGDGHPVHGSPAGRRLAYESDSNSTEQLELLQEAYQSLLSQQCKQGPPSVDNLHWELAGSLFFAFQLMTTVGYGSFVPATSGGRAATIVCGAIGIIVTGITTGVQTAVIDGWLEGWHDRLLKARHARRFAIRFKAAATTLLLCVYHVLVALCAMAWEGWDIEISVYFTFITISTIGLGDFTLSHQSVGSVLGQFVLLCPGLALFAEFVAIGLEISKDLDMRVKHEVSQARRSISGMSKRSSRIASKPAESEVNG